MLDDLPVVQAAVAAYRSAATAAGIRWPEVAGTRDDGPLEEVRRIFDVDHLDGALGWLHSLGLEEQPVLPEGAWLLPWPTQLPESLDELSFAFAVPFPWRRQLPLFGFDSTVFTFVLAGENEGEIWRYEFRPDTWDSVRAAPSLTALFTQWTRAITTGVISRAGQGDRLQVGAGIPNDPFRVLLEQAPILDPFAFPVSVPDEALLRERQRECGVDMDRIDDAECHARLIDEINTVIATLAR